MTTVNDVVNIIEQLAPPSLAEEWDNVGLLIGDRKKEVTKILVTLDLDKRTLDEAINCGANMIVTHHPVIMSGIKSITDELYIRAIENKVSIYSAHTSLDCAENGVNYVLANGLCLTDIEDVDLEGFTTKGGKANNTLKGFIADVKKALNIDYLRYVGDLENKVNKVCVVGGSGGDFIPMIKELGFDTLVTADVKYHQAQIADKIGLNVIDAGHFETENPVIYKVADYIKENLSGAEVITSLRRSSYIKYE